MKICELRFKNLNSLYGEWIIDFTDPMYESNGIFSLTGPTGAGKSTILDAICLALYGQTPRLKNITKSSNEIMSRQTGECYAEVLFQSSQGKFRARWSQQRARKKPDGALQDANHEISDAISNIIIEEKKSLVGLVIEEKTGMDFDRFTRSILLAQGGFDSFLKAGSEDKSRILEQITGTSIYSDISIKVFERQREELEKLTLLKAQLSGITVLSAEDEHAIEEDILSKRSTESELVQKVHSLGESLKWLMTLQQYSKEIALVQDELVILERNKSEFSPMNELLLAGNRAAELEPIYAKLSLYRKQQETNQATRTHEEKAIPQLLVQRDSSIALWEQAKGAVELAKTHRLAQLPMIQKVRELDFKREELLKKYQIIHTEVKGVTDQISQAEISQTTLSQKSIQIKICIDEIVSYLQSNCADERLVSELGVITQQIQMAEKMHGELQTRRSELVRAEKEVGVTTTALTEAQKQVQMNAVELTAISEQIKMANESEVLKLNGRELREYRDQRDTLYREQALLQKIASLEDERARLVDGCACPLCGSENHPFAMGNIPSVDEVSSKIIAVETLIREVEQISEAVRTLDKSRSTLVEKQSAVTQSEIQISNRYETAKRVHEELKLNILSSEQNIHDLCAELLFKLQPWGIGSIDNSTIDTLQNRLRIWNEHSLRRVELEKELSVVQSEIASVTAVIETVKKSQEQKISERSSIEIEGKQVTEKRKELFGLEKPEEVEKQLENAIIQAEQSEKIAQEKHSQLTRQAESVQKDIDRLSLAISSLAPELSALSDEFSAELYRVKFTSEKQFTDSLLSLEKRAELSATAERLAHRQTELSAKLVDRSDRLSVEQARNLTNESQELLEPQKVTYEKSLEEIRQILSQHTYRLSESRAAREYIQEKERQITLQTVEFARWDRMNVLIGSKDGKKYRVFAQGLTFELMISHANRELAKMSDRYLLIRDSVDPLKLNVIDNYQAGEIRSVQNLSGGETFIVSLTLALGLSKMASRRVRVDSLFLDEGFGTLDEDALETALETLSSLNEEGKLIGIISHVTALKERITTQIQVNPASGGKSTIFGPGCSKAS